MKTSLKASLIATAIATLPFGSQAAGLGAINVFSGLGQPLRAEIELNATPQELQSLTARIPAPDAFREANVSYSAAAARMRIAVENRGNRAVVRLTSDRPINDPFVDLLLELNWASGRMIREYTFLLDPVELGTGTQMAAASPAAAPAPSAAAPLSRPPAHASADTRPPGDSYQVQRGDTARAIADRYRPQGTSLDQMLIALLRENPSAFEEGNINRLRAGAILNLPKEGSVSGIEPAEARREVIAQAADFEAYRRRLAGAVAARPAAAEQAPSRSSSGTIAARVDEKASSADQGDRVQVSGARSEGASPSDADGARSARLQALEEELVAREKALEEANSRLAQLEASIRDMQQLLQLQNQNLAKLQEQAGRGEQAMASPPPPPAADGLQTPPAETPAPAIAATAAEQPPAAAEQAVEPGQTQAAAAETAAPPAPPVQQQQPAPKPPVRPAAPPPAPVPEPSFIDSMMEDPTLVAGGGGILLLLLGYAGYKSYARRKAEAATATLAPLSELPPETNSVFGVTGGQSVDTSSSSVIHTDFSQSGLSAIDADEGVDPVAEADVYMAYGRDAQAEEILLDALKADSSRSAIFVKLLEIYAQRKNLKQFENIATDLYSRTNGEGSDWAKAAEMGRRLDPDNPLYSASPIAQEQGPATEVPPSASMAGALGAAVAGAGLGAAASPGKDEEAPSGTPLADLDFTSSFPKAPAPAARESAPMEATPSQLKDTWTMPGGLSQRVQSMDDVPASPEAAAEELEPLPAIDSSALDFDLGGDFEPVISSPAATPEPASVAAEEGAEPVGTSSQDLTLDLDLDLDGPEQAPANVPALGEVNTDAMSETVVAQGNDLVGIASSLDFDLGGEEAEPQPEPAMSFNMSATALNAPTGNEERAAVTDLEQSSFDSSLLDFQFDLEATSSDIRPEPALDLSGIDLELDVPGEEGEMSPPSPSAAPAPSFGGVEEPAGDEVGQEVDTKLELANAYEEMGDKEGARELVEEVLREGSARQREAASRLLERLA